MDAYGPDDLVHRLPRTRIVDRARWLTDECRGRRVVHVGFTDAGFREQRQQTGDWLHQRLAEVATSLTGLDADAAGVAEAVAAGYDARLVDCTDPAAVAGLDVEPADVVLAGEVIEHVAEPGRFLDAMRVLCRRDGRLVVTTPNAYGLVNVVAGIGRGVEINHPDHVVVFSWRTLTELMRRRGWHPTETVTYVPVPRGLDDRSRLEIAGLRTVLAVERLLGRIGRPFGADGLIVVAEPT